MSMPLASMTLAPRCSVMSVVLMSVLRFDDEVERGLCHSAERPEPRLLEDLPEAGFARLGAEAEPDLLRQRVRRADARGHRVEHRRRRVVRHVGRAAID